MLLTSWRKFGEMRIAHRISGARKLQMIYIYMYITLEKTPMVRKRCENCVETIRHATV